MGEWIDIARWNLHDDLVIMLGDVSLSTIIKVNRMVMMIIALEFVIVLALIFCSLN